MKKLKTRVVGEYTVTRTHNGCFRIGSLKNPELKRYILPRAKFREKYDEQMRNGKVSPSLLSNLYYVPLTVGEQPGARRARELLKRPSRLPRVCPQEIDDEIRRMYPPAKIEKLQRGGHVQLPSLREFIKSRAGTSVVRRGSVKGAFERVYSPEKYPDLYFHLSRTVRGAASVSKQELQKDLLLNFHQGRTINPDLLARSIDPRERRMFAKIRALALNSGKGSLILPRKAPLEVVQNLTGISKLDISIYSLQMQDYSWIADYMTRFIFRNAHLLGLKVSYLKGSTNLRDERMYLEFTYHDRRGALHDGRADLRNGNRLIEVKARLPVNRQKTASIEDIKVKCAVGEINSWETWDSIRRSLVVLHQDPNYSGSSAKLLRKEGILVMEYPKIREYLTRLIPLVKEKYGPALEGLRPGFHLDDLVQIEDELCLSPFRLLRGSMSARREWTLDLLKALDARTKEIQKNGGIMPEAAGEQIRLETLCCGREIQYAGGHFMYVKKSLEELGMEEVGDFIKKNRQKLSDPASKKRFPELARIPTEDILFFDIETGGFLYRGPIHTIALAHINNGMYAECLAARNPGEERAMLQYFLDNYCNFKKYFTYNGVAFDVPFVADRMQQNGVFAEGKPLEGFEECLGNRHTDLYSIFKNRMGNTIIDHKLATAEKVILGHTRTGDVPGKDIPKYFRSFSYGEQNAARGAAKVIEHNMKDAFTTAALLMYLRG